MAEDRTVNVKIHLDAADGGGYITVSMKGGNTFSDVKEALIKKASVKLGKDKLKEASQYCFQLKSTKTLVYDEQMKLTHVTVVETGTFVELLLMDVGATKDQHKLLNDRVYFHFGVRRRNPMTGDTQDRLLHFDFVEKTVSTLQKETVQKTFPFSSLLSFSRSDTDKLYFRMEFKKSAPYECYSQTPEERTAILQILKHIVADNLDNVVNSFPRTVLYRGFVEKKEPKGGTWSKRFIIVVPFKLFCFAGATGVAHPRNLLALNQARVSSTKNEFDIELNNGYNFHFRVGIDNSSSVEDQKALWSWALVQASQYSLLPKLVRDAEKTVTGRKRAKTQDVQRSVLNMAVFFNYAVLEAEGTSNQFQTRIVNFNLSDRSIKIVQKEIVKRKVPFDDVINVKLLPNSDLGIQVELYGAGRLNWMCQTSEERHIIFSLLNKVRTNNLSGLDANKPRLILKSGYADKREPTGVWKKRFLMLCPWKLFCFRDVTGVAFPRNLVSLYNAQVAREGPDRILVSLGDGYKFLFRLPSEAQRDEWIDAITEALNFDLDEDDPDANTANASDAANAAEESKDAGDAEAPQSEDTSATAEEDQVSSPTAAPAVPDSSAWEAAEAAEEGDAPAQPEQTEDDVVDAAVQETADDDGSGTAQDASEPGSSEAVIEAAPVEAGISIGVSLAVEEETTGATDTSVEAGDPSASEEGSMVTVGITDPSQESSAEEDEALQDKEMMEELQADFEAEEVDSDEEIEQNEQQAAAAGGKAFVFDLEEEALANEMLDKLKEAEAALDANLDQYALVSGEQRKLNQGDEAFAAEVQDLELGSSTTAQQVEKERQERMKIQGYQGIGNKANIWKLREQTAAATKSSAIPEVKAMR